MKTILENLRCKEKWEEFYDDRIGSHCLSAKQIEQLRSFIDEKKYKKIADAILNEDYSFAIPLITYISKGGSEKKRIVYRFPDDELWILKHIAYLLHKYDNRFFDACYSFRRGRNAKTAVREVLSIEGIKDKYCLKADIHDYFNSIPRERLCIRVEEFINDDDVLKRFLTGLLSVDTAKDPETNELIMGNRGAMAGTPLSPFLANLYLLGLDESFTDENVIYLRYADDILIFADSYEQICEIKEELIRLVEAEGLRINEDKTMIIEPGNAWEFLGFKYDRGTIDISDNTKRKLKAKIKRKSHALYRWRIRKNTTFEQTAFVLIRAFNNKFYDIDETGEFSWSRWFFPLINTDTGLGEIDRYLVKYIRFLYKGRHYKGNYRIRYENLKSLGFRPLVAEYYARKK